MSIVSKMGFSKVSLVVLFFFIGMTTFFVWWINKNVSWEIQNMEMIPSPSPKPIWEKKVEIDQILKIGLITDTHVHPNRIDKNDKNDFAPRILKGKHLDPFNKFNLQMAIFGPELIIHLGDIIEGTDDEDFVGIMGLKLVRDELAKNGVPVYWIVGNHDLRSVTKSQFLETLEIDSLNQVIDQGDYRLIILDASYKKDGTDISPGNGHIPGNINQNTIEWLEDKLKTEKRVFVFMHQAPLVKKDENGANIKNPISNSESLIKIFDKYNVEAVFNGHIELKSYIDADDVKYYSFPGTKKSDAYRNSFYELTIDKAIPQVRMFYTDQENGLDKSIDFEESNE